MKTQIRLPVPWPSHYLIPIHTNLNKIRMSPKGLEIITSSFWLKMLYFRNSNLTEMLLLPPSCITSYISNVHKCTEQRWKSLWVLYDLENKSWTSSQTTKTNARIRANEQHKQLQLHNQDMKEKRLFSTSASKVNFLPWAEQNSTQRKAGKRNTDPSSFQQPPLQGFWRRSMVFSYLQDWVQTNWKAPTLGSWLIMLW